LIPADWLVTVIGEKIAFLHVPKTGGTWATAALEAAGVELQEVGMHATLSDLPSSERFRIAFVREPLSWYRSYWLHRNTRGDWRGEPLDVIADCSFEEFLQNVISRRPNYLGELFNAFVGQNGSEIEFVGRYERLVDDLVEALKKARVEFDETVLRSFPPTNVSSTELSADVSEEVKMLFMLTHWRVYERFYPEHLEGVGSRSIAERLEFLAPLGGIYPGHLHSPYPSPMDLHRASPAWKNPRANITGIDLNEPGQLTLLKELSPFCQTAGLATEQTASAHFHHVNPILSGGDAETLQAMVRYLRPRRVIEVGTGHATAIALDVASEHLNADPELTIVGGGTPIIRRLRSGKTRNRIEFQASSIHKAPMALFESLEPRDVLYVDSSHVSKVGSDVNHLVFEVLPRLRPDVRIHFRGIFYPFEYPRHWIVRDHKAWNEAYVLRAFLQDNTNYEIELFLDWLKKFHTEEVERTCPTMLWGEPSSLWLRVAG
jgi:hypothetical protein